MVSQLQACCSIPHGRRFAQPVLNLSKSAIQRWTVVTYHFKGSNGKRYMTIQRPYDAAEVAMLNDKVNALREAVAANEAALAESAAVARTQLQRQLTECQNAPKQVETIVTNTNTIVTGICHHLPSG